MYLIPLGLFIKAWGPPAGDLAALTWPAFFMSLIPVTLGNIIGGGGLVGGVYWFIYLRKRPRA